jgi:hypothetical protein
LLARRLLTRTFVGLRAGLLKYPVDELVNGGFDR